MLEGRNYANTVMSIKSVVDFPTLGEEIRKIKRIREGHALIEFGKKSGS